jgi:hypothetical protein
MGLLWWLIHPIKAFKYRRGEGCGICGYDPICDRDWNGHCPKCHRYA